MGIYYIAGDGSRAVPQYIYIIRTLHSDGGAVCLLKGEIAQIYGQIQGQSMAATLNYHQVAVFQGLFHVVQFPVAPIVVPGTFLETPFAAFFHIFQGIGDRFRSGNLRLFYAGGQNQQGCRRKQGNNFFQSLHVINLLKFD